jgi:hypothetical protein
MTGCSPDAESTPATNLPAEQMVFMVMSSGGMAPAVYQALASPSLAIYGDGRVLTAVESPALQLIPTRYEVARIDPAAVTSFVADVEADGTDFGTPRMTDLPSTTVMMYGPGGEQRVNPYAFDERFDARLTPEQRSARVALRTIISRAAALTAGAPRMPYSPDRVVVYEVEARTADEPGAVNWPGPPPASFLSPYTGRRSIACGALVADPAEVVYQAALENPGARWVVDGATRALAVNSLPLPGDCS